jgi:hypothetical protein
MSSVCLEVPNMMDRSFWIPASGLRRFAPVLKRMEPGYSALHTIETSFTLVPVFPVIIKEFSCLKKPWLL